MSSPALPGIASVGQISISVQDVARAVAFYRDVLGLRLLFEASGMAFFDCGGVRLMLTIADPKHTPERRAQDQTSILYYKTSDIMAAAAALRGKGVRIEREPHLIAKMPDHDLWMAFLRDSEGNLLGLMSEIRPPA